MWELGEGWAAEAALAPEAEGRRAEERARVELLAEAVRLVAIDVDAVAMVEAASPGVSGAACFSEQLPLVDWVVVIDAEAELLPVSEAGWRSVEATMMGWILPLWVGWCVSIVP